MKIIGRKREKDSLMQSIMSKRPEFVVVYGRRRVGKTTDYATVSMIMIDRD